MWSRHRRRILIALVVTTLGAAGVLMTRQLLGISSDNWIPVTPSRVVGDYRHVKVNDGLELSADGGFRHCWDIDGRQKVEHGRWELEGEVPYYWVHLEGFSDIRSSFGATPASIGAFVSQPRGQIRINFDADASDYFDKLGEGARGCAGEWPAAP